MLETEWRARRATGSSADSLTIRRRSPWRIALRSIRPTGRRVRGTRASITPSITTYFRASSPWKGEVGWGSDRVTKALQDMAF